ncbi:MAG: hypothetical protein J3K34DRAFT_171739 [Monoraphidium minutum]|nr:MAG: hypothetical protein J3K34DRAFT_171739 [Monoraphidium minutum]
MQPLMHGPAWRRGRGGAPSMRACAHLGCTSPTQPPPRPCHARGTPPWHPGPPGRGRAAEGAWTPHAAAGHTRPAPHTAHTHARARARGKPTTRPAAAPTTRLTRQHPCLAHATLATFTQRDPQQAPAQQAHTQTHRVCGLFGGWAARHGCGRSAAGGSAPRAAPPLCWRLCMPQHTQPYAIRLWRASVPALRGRGGGAALWAPVFFAGHPSLDLSNSTQATSTPPPLACWPRVAAAQRGAAHHAARGAPLSQPARGPLGPPPRGRGGALAACCAGAGGCSAGRARRGGPRASVPFSVHSAAALWPLSPRACARARAHMASGPALYGSPGRCRERAFI